MVSILENLENKSIMVTGAAGFLSKILVEKILRTQPNVKKLYLLLRAADKESANLRLQNEIIGKELFKVLKAKVGEDYFQNFIREKVVMVPGDTTSANDLGIQENTLKQEMWNSLDVIFNLAATTSFDEMYDVSLYINTFGAKHVLEFAKKCTNLNVLVHVSTAYVCGEETGSILEKPYRMGGTLNGEVGLDVEEERRLVMEKLSQLQAEKVTNDTLKLAMKDMGRKRARTFGWPNVYVFTKALGEMLIMKYNQGSNLNLVIIRPAIVSSTFKEPFPGWVEGLRTMDSLLVGYGKGKITSFPIGIQTVSDTIPGDMVINAMIVAAMTMTHVNPHETMIYHLSSGIRNPLKNSQIIDLGYCYFSKYPCTSKSGNPVIINRGRIYSSVASFQRYLTIRYLVPLKGLQLASIVFPQSLKSKYLNYNRRIKYILRLLSIYEPYLFFKGIFDDSNTERLRLEAKKSGVEMDLFYFDPKVINWEDYFMHSHMPGLVKYVLK